MSVSLSAGIYLVKIQAVAGIEVKKLVIHNVLFGRKRILPMLN